MVFFKKMFLFRKKWLNHIGRPVLRVIEAITFVASILVISGIIYQIGFPLSNTDLSSFNTFYRLIKLVYLLYIILVIIVERKELKKKYRHVFWVLSGLLYLTIIPWLFPDNLTNPVLSFIVSALDNYYLHLVLLFMFSLLMLSNGVIRLLGKRTNPSLILAVSFLFIILLGTIFLKMPRCTINGIGWIDALFTSTSAVCVTGLTSVEMAATFTSTGFFVILLLIQIGGVGVMTLTSFFALFFMGNASLYNQLIVKDLVSSNAIGNSLWKTMLYVLLFTLLIEALGALTLFHSIHGTLDMNLKQEVMFVIFHAISAFCNAGFSTLPGNLGNPMILYNHASFYLIISFLIIFGGLGFPILVNFKDVLKHYLKKIWRKLFRKPPLPHIRHLYNINTKIVLVSTTILLLVSTLFIAFFEWNHSFAGLSVGHKLVQSFFNAVVPRTAGFTSINPSTFHIQTILLIMILMWIGGGAQSTAGGIKVNAFSVSFLNLIAVVRNTNQVEVFGRTLPADSIRRSNATIILSLFTLLGAIFILTLTDSHLSLLQVSFEAFSALGTVGSSLNITPSLSNLGKIVIIGLMFVGRVGLITLLLGLIKPKKLKYQYPVEHIIIN
ncbi:MAG: potassium transporter TrkG [Bacteroidales bacterium]